MWALTLLVAALLRFSTLGWDTGLAVHPDERGIVFAAEALHLPSRLSESLSPSSGLNPMRGPAAVLRPYVYGHLPLYLLRAAESLLPDSVESLCRLYLASPPCETSFTRLLLLGRLVAALADSLTVLVVGLLAARLAGWRAALLASALYAFSPFALQNAHLATVDAPAACCATVALWAALRLEEGRRWAILAGFSAGLAMAFKISIAPLWLAALLAIKLSPALLLRIDAATRPNAGRLDRVAACPGPGTWLPVLTSAGPLVTAFGLSLLTLFVCTPYLLLDLSAWLAALSAQSRISSGALWLPFTAHFAALPRLIHPMGQLLLYGLGPFGAGILILALRRLDWSRYAFLFAWLLAGLFLAAAPYAAFARYWLPVLPAALALAAVGLVTLTPHWRASLGAAALIWNLLLAAAALAGLLQPHPYLKLTHWLDLRGDVRVILVESWSEPLPVAGWIEGRYRDPAREYDLRTFDPWQTGEAHLESLSRDLSEADLLILSSQRAAFAATRLSQRHPLSAQLYQLLADGSLGYDISAAFSRLNPLEDSLLRHGWVEFSLLEYDRPLVLVYENRGRLSPESISEVLAVGSTRDE